MIVVTGKHLQCCATTAESLDAKEEEESGRFRSQHIVAAREPLSILAAERHRYNFCANFLPKLLI